MNPRPIKDRWLTVDEVRTVADLRIMHAKVDELWHLCQALLENHDEQALVTYADPKVLAQDIKKVDQLYLMFIRIKEESERRRKKRANGA